MLDTKAMSEPLTIDDFTAAYEQLVKPSTEYPQRDQLVRVMSPEEYHLMSEPKPVYNVNELRSGRELDALVAEAVMGWWDIKWVGGQHTRVLRATKKRWPPVWGESENQEITIPEFSEEIAAAWSICDHLFRPRPGIDRDSQAEVAKRFIQAMHKDHLPLFTMKREDAARAICLSAMKAVGGDNEQS